MRPSHPWLLPWTFLILMVQCTGKKQEPSFFSFHLFMEPQHLDPGRSYSSSASYFFHNILRGLYRVDSQNQLVAEGGHCQWAKARLLTCELKKSRWSNGDPLTAKDYVRRFQSLVDPTLASPRASLLKYVKNFKAIMKGQKTPKELGVSALGPSTLAIEFEVKDQEFLYKLSSTALYPLHQDHPSKRENFKNFVGNGPYQIQSWTWGQNIILVSNPHYHGGYKKRPPVKIYFVDHEKTAFRLYEKKKLKFLRRIPSELLSTLNQRQDFFRQPMLRFDYIGFGQSLMKKTKLRQALFHAIDYKALGTLLGSRHPVGCPSIPKAWLLKSHCYQFDLKKAKSLWSQLRPEEKALSLDFKISRLGGQDIRKQAEFIQNQWKKHLGLEVQIKQVDQKLLLSQLRKEPADIFRKGVGLDRPTCHNALETFSSDSFRNYIQLEDQTYLQTLEKMKGFRPHSLEYKRLCQKAMDHLLGLYRMIPLGEMDFSLMASPEFTGWTLNGLNQLDLSQLRGPF